MVPECVPRELGDRPMILMKVFPVVGQDEIGRDPQLEILEEILDLASVVREEPIPEVADDDFSMGCLLEKGVSTSLDLFGALLPGAQDDPADLDARKRLEKVKDRPPAPDLDVV